MSNRTPQGSNGQSITNDKLLVSMGCYDGLTTRNRFGTVTAVGASFEHVWQQAGAWVKIPTATTLEVASTDVDDKSDAGDGARTVTIEGLDANYAELIETVNLDGQTVVTTTGVFLFVNRMYVATAGTIGVNQGTIAVADDSTSWSSGAPSTAAAVQGVIAQFEGETQNAIYTVPAGIQAYLTALNVFAGETLATEAVTFKASLYRNTENTKRLLFGGTITNQEYVNALDPYISIPEKTTIMIEALVSTGTAMVSAGFSLLEVDKSTYGL